MVEDHLPGSDVNGRDNSIGPRQQGSLRRIVIRRIHCKKTFRRDLLRRPDHDKTGDGSTRCLRGLGAGPREEDCCKTENKSEYEPFPCHDCGPFSLEESSPSACPTTHSMDRVKGEIRPCCKPMSNGDYREKDGGARL